MDETGLGKVDRDFLRRVLLRNLGAGNKDVLVGPGMGLDNAIVSVGAGRVMVATADPLSMIPSLGMRDSAWLTFHELASDLATSGVKPQFAVLDYNLPPSLEMKEFGRYVRAFGEECAALGVSIIGGHTGKYPGSDYTIVGGGMMLGFADESSYVTPGMMQDGDDVMMTKGSAIEATAVLSRTFPGVVEAGLGGKMARRALSYLGLCSTVQDALVAGSVGLRSEGITSMHDATEGGVLGGLYELARSGESSLTIQRDEIIITQESAGVCRLFGLDPLVTLSEGTLLLTCRPEASARVLRRLSDKGISASVIGEVARGADGSGGGRKREGRRTRSKSRQGRLLLTADGKTASYLPPKFDPYWAAYTEGLEKGWK
jgi:hydrogenase expression/formation protein HypE